MISSSSTFLICIVYITLYNVFVDVYLHGFCYLELLIVVQFLQDVHLQQDHQASLAVKKKTLERN